MTDKDNVSMATVQMKADYAASEVYSTASEPPPAYKRQANSVKIAKITAFTIIVSSFILGAFILASSYLQAKASCDQVQALDSVLEKELMLETLQQVNKELPRAEALLGKESSDEADLQNLDKDESIKKTNYKPQSNALPQSNNIDENNDNDNSYSEVIDNDEMSKFPGKVPLELDLSDLAATLLRNNKKSRMNCVVERKHAEEIVDSPSKTVALPFGVNLKTDPKKARITGERISIFCDGGDDSKEQDSRNNREEDDDTEEDAEPIRPMFIPFNRLPIPFGRMPQQFPLTHMPQRMMPPVQLQQQQPQHQIPQQLTRQMPPLPPFHQLPLRPPMPPQMWQAPQQQQSENMIFAEGPQQQTVRIHVQQIPFREIHVADDVPVQIPSRQQELPHFQIQRVPLGEALQRAGITPEDLRNIQRMAEERITDQLKRWVPDEEDDDDSNNSDEINTNDSNSNENEQTSVSGTSSEERSQSAEQQPPQQQNSEQPSTSENQDDQEMSQQQQPEQRQQSEANEQPIMQQPARLILQPLPEQPTQNQMTPLGRVVFGRSLAQPVRIPVPMMQAQADASEPASASNEESERPHFVQPRSSSFK